MNLRPALIAVALSLAFAATAADRPLDTVIAKRGGTELTLGEFDARIMEVPPEHRAGFVDDGKRLEDTIRQMLLLEQLADEARAAGLDKDPAFAYQVKLAENRILAYYRTQQLVQQQAKGDFEALAQEAYLANKKAYAEPDTLILRHILVRSDKHTDSEALALAQAAHRDAMAGKAFEALVQQYSDDENGKKEKGILPPVEPGKTEPPFDEAAFKLTKPGEIAPIIKTRHGYHVIQLVERKVGRQPTFDEIKPTIVAKLRADHTAKLAREHSDKLQSMKLDFDPLLVGELRTRFGEGPNAATATQPALPMPNPAPAPAPGPGGDTP